MDQQLAQVYVTTLGDPLQARFASGRLLSRDETEPGCKIAPARKTLPFTDGGHESSRVQHADPGNGGQLQGALIRTDTRGELVVEGVDAPVQLTPLGPHIVDQHPDAPAQGWLIALQDGGERAVQLCAIPAE